MKKLFFLFIIALTLYSCGSVPITGRRQLNLVSDAEILSLSSDQYSDFIKTAKKSTDRAAVAQVETVGSRIAAAVAAYYKANGQEKLLEGYQWEFTLVDDAQVNAFCMPGGKIVVYSGILPYTKDETGLAVVVGHEVGHAIAKHANERMSQQVALSYGGAAVGAALGKSSALIQTIGSQVFGLGAQVGVMLPFNRKQELEADRLGMILMAMAGYDPSATLPFWERMSQQGGSKPIEFLSTHPSDATRIASIQKEIPEAMKYYTGAKSTSPSKGSTTSNQWRY
jgi:predicted Zn-dependent protease